MLLHAHNTSAPAVHSRAQPCTPAPSLDPLLLRTSLAPAPALLCALCSCTSPALRPLLLHQPCSAPFAPALAWLYTNLALCTRSPYFAPDPLTLHQISCTLHTDNHASCTPKP
ncbi:hypothetical protein SLEP1_g42877 [Rubroshorea leprosula]|uniref:Uncharacterized protein n=1 Tax=Rubroshorea leprosula TaxID=152421 RepID=A0AAV5LB88_9ROSI|nr:hypothetical protein SLEP1_g42877 [Rubroshorea leprosula]